MSANKEKHAVTLQAGGESVPLEVRRGMTGMALSIATVIARDEDATKDANASRCAYYGPYLLASVEAVHLHGCAATKNGKKSGPCDCGGNDLWKAFLEKAGIEYILKP